MLMEKSDIYAAKLEVWSSASMACKIDLSVQAIEAL